MPTEAPPSDMQIFQYKNKIRRAHKRPNIIHLQMSVKWGPFCLNFNDQDSIPTVTQLLSVNDQSRAELG